MPKPFTKIVDYTLQELDEAVNVAAALCKGIDPNFDFWKLLTGIDAYFERRRRKMMNPDADARDTDLMVKELASINARMVTLEHLITWSQGAGAGPGPSTPRDETRNTKSPQMGSPFSLETGLSTVAKNQTPGTAQSPERERNQSTKRR